MCCDVSNVNVCDEPNVHKSKSHETKQPTQDCWGYVSLCVWSVSEDDSVDGDQVTTVGHSRKRDT